LTPFSAIEEALEDIKQGKLIILVDSPDRENEGDFFMAAQAATPEKVNFMIRHGRGLVCVTLDSQQAKRLGLSPMVPAHQNTESTKINFTISVNAKHGITTGISAFDRAKTIQVLASPESTPEDITKPGHVFPLIAHAGGLAARQGHTEAEIALTTLAGLNPAGVTCEILKNDGRMARMPDLIKIAKKFQLKLVSITDLERYVATHPVAYAAVTGSSVVRTATARLPTKYGVFDIFIYRSLHDDSEHTALILGGIAPSMLTRVHSQCLTGDTLGSLLCDCGEQLQLSLELIRRRGSGVLLYLNQEGRGIGLTNKIRAYAQQAAGLDTVEANLSLGFAADERDYTVAADMLHDLGIGEVELLTNNPVKVSALTSHNIQVSKRTALETKPTALNRKYLTTKKRKLGHQLDLV
jgi:3,4-dihydroxy 2-butanone 4-phosphate synthase / GTP cyclohydrolase II